ncbi:MAG: CitMHS family transporter [Gemmatimonadetes bacterium]|nr:CitMHS family transporter [Gemmatimonadota bacterium]
MLTLLAFGMVIVFMTLIMTKRLSPLVALILVPIVFGLLAGFSLELGEMMLTGIRNLAPTGVMLMFAILYFAIMMDAGLFEPFVKRIVVLVHGDPLKVIVGTAALALVVSLDGDGSTTYMITTAAMLPLYRRMGMRLLNLACVVMLAGGVMNILPWGGPTARAVSALGLEMNDVFVPMIPAMVAGAVWVLFVAYRLGLRERARLATEPTPADGLPPVLEEELANPSFHEDEEHRRPDRLVINALLTAVLLVGLVSAVLPLPALFMLGFAIAMMLNYPSIDEQKSLLSRHAGNVLAVVGLIFAAGVFTGILSGTEMVDAMANSVVGAVPTALGPYLAVVTAVLSAPFTFFVSNDAFYFGILPILAAAGDAYGITAAEMARASLIGQPVHLLSPLVPSTYLLVGLVGVDFDDHQRYTMKWALMSVCVLLAVALLTAVVPLVGSVVP